jgi:bacterioferritin B
MTTMIGDELTNALNEQIGNEFAASMQYLSIAAYFDRDNLVKLAKIFYEQAGEERDHGMKLMDYLIRAGASVRIPSVAAPKHDFVSAEEAVGLSLQWEVEVAGQYNRLMDLAASKNDYLAQDFLNWFVTEQLEEVSKMRRIYEVVKRAGSNLLMVEAYLSHIE